MNIQEIVLQLTLKALEQNAIQQYNGSDNPAQESAENAKYVATYYNTLYDEITKHEKRIASQITLIEEPWCNDED